MMLPAHHFNVNSNVALHQQNATDAYRDQN